MNFHISEIELKLLAYLHEKVDGYGYEFRLEPVNIMQGLSISSAEMAKAGSYLDQHKLVGFKVATSFDSSGELVGFTGLSIHLTGLGEDYMRALEQQPGIMRKITVGAVAELWNSGKSVLASTASAMLGEFTKHLLGR